MQYLNALKAKGLKESDLSKGLQGKIDKLNSLLKDLKVLESRDLDEDEKEQLETVKEVIDDLDIQIAKKVSIFDMEKYKRRLDQVEDMKMRKEAKKTQKVEEKVAPKVEKPVETPKIEQKLSELKEEVRVDTQRFNEEPMEVETEEEVEEFEKKAEVKPKKMSTSLILMGVGAFFLTWGAVNFFRERR